MAKREISKARPAAPAKAAPVKAPAKAGRSPFITNDPAKALAHFLTEARALDPGAVESCARLDADLMKGNVATSLISIKPFVARAHKELLAVDVPRALEAGSLALAFMEADRVLNGPAPTSPDPSTPADEADPDAGLSLRERTSKMFTDRSVLLDQLRVFLAMGVFPQASYDAILADRGPLDGARDVLAGDAALDGDKLKGRHPITDAWRMAARARARRVLAEVKPVNAPGVATERSPAAFDRDAIGELLLRAHKALRTIGMVYFGEKELDAKVPPLMSRAAPSTSKGGGTAGGTGGGGATGTATAGAVVPGGTTGGAVVPGSGSGKG